MEPGLPHYTGCIPANPRQLGDWHDHGGGNKGQRAGDRLPGPQAMSNRPWALDEIKSPDGLPGANTRVGPGVAVVHACRVSDQRSDDLTEDDVENLNAVLGHEVAENTLKNYRAQWRNFISWAVGKGVRALPADPAQVAAYLAERIEELGHKPATLRVASSAIAFVHRASGQDDPCSSQEVRRILRAATRKAGRWQKQARALTAEAMAAIQSTVCRPRRGRGGRVESRETARRRGNLDIALISLMRDAMLREIGRAHV